MSLPALLLHDQALAIANAMQEHLCDLLEDLNVPTVRCCLGQGEPPPMDECCVELGGAGTADRDGFAWVAIGPWFPTREFPNQLEAVDHCPGGLAQQYTVGIYRCAPVVKDDGAPPTCEEVAAAVLRQTQDAAIIRRAIRCSLEAAGKTFVMQLGAPIAPRGGCMGASQQVLVHNEDCLSCTPIDES